MLSLSFRGGTLELHGLDAEHELPESCVWDTRIGAWRAPAASYASLVLWLRKHEHEWQDQARAYEELTLDDTALPAMRPYQTEALQAWLEQRSRGVVVLPTGAGKTQLAMRAIYARQRSTLVIVPTLELVRQWTEVLQRSFAQPVGIVGGGSHEVLPLTVTTYDSAHLHMGHLGKRFGLLVVDECHHLPTESYAFAARGSIAPFRLGLTATPERSDGGMELYEPLLGPLVYRKDIVELSGSFLADYVTEQVSVPMVDEERQLHDEARATFRGFVAKHRIPLGSPSGFRNFLRVATRSHEGQAALRAYRLQKSLALFGRGKLEAVGELLQRHAHDRVLVFTEDNRTAYHLATSFLVPVITHKTRVIERLAALAGFRDGSLPVLVTSKVLNEGVDVPEANVAIVVSGSGSVREHVQRLGRVLRPSANKQAMLYELVTADSSDEGRSTRRRDHSAYR